LADQLSDGIAGPQKPRQAELIGGALPNQRDDLLLLEFRLRRLLPWTAAATLLTKPWPAALPIAFDPAVDGVVVDAKDPGDLRLGHAVQHRSDGPVTQRRLGRSRR
jgi:hypothetical protein